MRPVVASLLALSCAAADVEAPAAPDAAASPAPMTIEAGTHIPYRLEWSWEGTTTEGDARVLTTDLGYTVGITRLVITSAGMELLPCQEPRTAGLFDWLVPTARAAHVYRHDESVVIATVVEDAFATETAALGVGTASGNRYCRLHYLAAPGTGSAPDGTDMTGLSAAVSGWYRPPGSDTSAPLDGDVNLRAGSLLDLHAASGADVAVRLIRRPARALDGVALEALSPQERTFELLKGLCWSAEAILESR